jgi:hypothetical protein
MTLERWTAFVGVLTGGALFAVALVSPADSGIPR